MRHAPHSGISRWKENRAYDLQGLESGKSEAFDAGLVGIQKGEYCASDLPVDGSRHCPVGKCIYPERELLYATCNYVSSVGLEAVINICIAICCRVVMYVCTGALAQR
jgi:hypothetical protein